jgi:small-conductance mechanosensitive channel
MNLFLEFQVGPYTASFWVVLVWMLVAVFTIVLHKVLQKSLKRYLKRAQFEIKGTRITALRILNQLLFVIAFIIAFQAFRIENEVISLTEFMSYNIIPEFKGFTLSFLDVLIIIIIFTASRFVINVFRLYIANRFKDNPDFDEGTRYVYVQLAKYIIYTFAVIISLQVVGFDLSILLAGSAALLIGFGFGVQDIFRDMVSGLLLLFEGTIKVGDIVRVSNSNAGEPMVARVLKINVRTTKIESRDGNTLIIPNSMLTQNQVENWSFGSDLTRFHIKVGVAYGSNTELVRDLLKQAVLAHPDVNKTKPVIVRLLDFGDNALEMEVLFWADQTWQVELHKSDIRFEIDRLFRQHGVEIPFPQRTLHIPGNVYSVQQPAEQKKEAPEPNQQKED